jgi:uncharacterized protein (DUF1330 family)
MPAYWIAHATVTDPEAYGRYAKLATEAIAAHGGRFLARGGAAELLEGDGELARIVLIEFPDLDTARGWYDGDLYREARAAREGIATARFVAVEGLA